MTVPDALPESTTGQLEEATPDFATINLFAAPHDQQPGAAATVDKGIWTVPNKFGVSRRYLSLPSSIPDGERFLVEMINEQDEDQRDTITDGGAPVASLTAQILDIIHPHPHFSSFLMNHWFYRPGATNKSKLDRDILVKNVILNPTFKPNDLAPPFSFSALDEALANSANGCVEAALPGTGWVSRNVQIEIPAMGSHPVTQWSTPGAYIRNIVHVIRETVEGPSSRNFNWDGYEEWWRPESTPQSPQRLYHNMYTSDSFLRAEAELRETEPIGYTGDPRRVLGLMFWSDATHLSDFGQASLHPIYMSFANQDKYERCHPSKRALHHIAYIPKVRSYVDLLSY
jgi:Plavaka transposase